jgi:hypothetical protein
VPERYNHGMAERYGWKQLVAILAVLIIAFVLVSFAAGGGSPKKEQNVTGLTGTIFVSGTFDTNL